MAWFQAKYQSAQAALVVDQNLIIKLAHICVMDIEMMKTWLNVIRFFNNLKL